MIFVLNSSDCDSIHDFDGPNPQKQLNCRQIRLLDMVDGDRGCA